MLRSLTANEKLIGVLTGQWGDYGLPPRQRASGAHAVVANHYLEAPPTPVGGASHRGGRRAIRAAGGELLIRAEVRSIVCENGRATGVELVDGRRITAPIVVGRRSAADLRAGARREPAQARFITGDRKDRASSCSMLCLFVALDGTDSELGFRTDKLLGSRLVLIRRRAFRNRIVRFRRIPRFSRPRTRLAIRYPGTSAVQVLVRQTTAGSRDGSEPLASTRPGLR